MVAVLLELFIHFFEAVDWILSSIRVGTAFSVPSNAVSERYINKDGDNFACQAESSDIFQEISSPKAIYISSVKDDIVVFLERFYYELTRFIKNILCSIPAFFSQSMDGDDYRMSPRLFFKFFREGAFSGSG